MTPEERKKRQAEYARKKYRRQRGLPEDAVLTKTPEEVAEKRRATRRAYDRKTKGVVPWAEYVANRRKEAAASRAAKEAEKRASDARKAAERQARKEAERWQTKFKKSTCATIAKDTSILRQTRKPGRLVASFGWNGW
jgi:hypothetical protein